GLRSVPAHHAGAGSGIHDRGSDAVLPLDRRGARLRHAAQGRSVSGQLQRGASDAGLADGDAGCQDSRRIQGGSELLRDRAPAMIPTLRSPEEHVSPELSRRDFVTAAAATVGAALWPAGAIAGGPAAP